jgi:hypothetical protein
MNLPQTALALTLALAATMSWQNSSCGNSRATNQSNGSAQSGNANSNMNSNTNSTVPSQTPSEVSRGTWGGLGISIEVGDPTASIEFDCAHATITEKMVLNREGKFQAKGFYVREKGGPVRADEVEERLPAIFTGEMKDKTLTLTVKLTDSKDAIGTFTLTHGKSGRLRKCL